MARPDLSRWLQLAPFGEDEDPTAAPGARKDCAARPWTLRRAWQNLLWVYAFGLVFLIFPAVELTDTESGSELVAGVVLIAVIAAMYLATSVVSDASLAARWAYIGAFVAVLFASATVWGWSFANFGAYTAIMTATLIPWRQARLAIPGWGVFLLLVAVLTETWTPAYIALIAVGIGLATGGAMESGRVSWRLSRAEQRVSVLAVAAERERIGRDLHDILGHSLTAIAIKSALAGRLIDTDPAAARAQLTEIEAVSRQALADVRATASGFREVRVATEVASARSVLLAAGIEARAASVVVPLSDERSELFGFVVREAVTNVVRHSGATTCTIEVDPDQIRVSDDGRGLQPGAGSGLAGLAERVQNAGGRLEVESVPGSGTTIRAWFAPSTETGRRSAPAAALARP